MPSTDGYGQDVPYPLLSDVANIEGFQATVNGLTSRSVLRFANANERSARLIGAFTPVPGMLTYLAAEDRWDRCDGDKVWRPLTPGQWKPLTFATGYVAFAGSPAYRIVNGECQLRGQFKRTDGSDLINQTATLFCTLPTEARPVGDTKVFIAASNFTTVDNVSRFFGRITVATNGQMGYLMGAGSQTGWLALDGIRFSLE